MRKNRVLVIDDEKDLCFFLKANLEARGDYRVQVANSGDDGESKIETSGLYCEGYVTKPVQADDLLARMKGILNLRRLE